MKQVIVMRKDLNLRKGKMVAQGGHAVLGVFLGRNITDQMELDNLTIEIPPYLKRWIETGMKKVCLGCDGLDELKKIVELAEWKSVPVYTVTDAGHTEIPAGTITCAAIGPYDDEIIDTITGHLKLL